MTSRGLGDTAGILERRYVLGIYHSARADPILGILSRTNFGAMDARSCAGTNQTPVFPTHSTVECKRPLTMALLIGQPNHPN
jgi:hypothetical protein